MPTIGPTYQPAERSDLTEGTAVKVTDGDPHYQNDRYNGREGVVIEDDGDAEGDLPILVRFNGGDEEHFNVAELSVEKMPQGVLDAIQRGATALMLPARSSKSPLMEALAAIAPKAEAADSYTAMNRYVSDLIRSVATGVPPRIQDYFRPRSFMDREFDNPLILRGYSDPMRLMTLEEVNVARTKIERGTSMIEPLLFDYFVGYATDGFKDTIAVVMAECKHCGARVFSFGVARTNLDSGDAFDAEIGKQRAFARALEYDNERIYPEDRLPLFEATLLAPLLAQ